MLRMSLDIYWKNWKNLKIRLEEQKQDGNKEDESKKSS